MRLSKLKKLLKSEKKIRVEAVRGTWIDYMVRVITYPKGKEKIELLKGGFFNRTLHFASVEEIKDFLGNISNLDHIYFRHFSPHGEIIGLSEKVAKRKEDDGIKIPLKWLYCITNLACILNLLSFIKFILN